MTSISNLDSSKEEVIELLKSIKSDDKNKNLYDHLQELFDTKLVIQNDEMFLDLFEDVSYRIRNQGFYFPPNDKQESQKKYLEHFRKANEAKKGLLKPLVKKDGDDEIPVTQVNFVPDYYSIFSNLEWCGISISDKESYLLTNALRVFLSERTDRNISQVTFWGKIFGKDKDYYVIYTPPLDGGNGKFLIKIKLKARNQKKQEELE